MSFVIEGKLVKIGDVEQINNTFKKREIVIELRDQFNGNDYYNYAKCQLLQNKVGIVDGYVVGDAIKAHFNIRGNKWERDGQVNYITNLDVWKIEDGDQKYQPYQPQPQSQPSAPPQVNPGAPGYNPSPENVDDLPF